MLEKIIDFFENIWVTALGGICLLASLFVPMLFDVSIPLWCDPAWLAVIVSGIPLLYLAIKRIIVNKGISKISSALLISIAMIAAIAIGDLFAAGEVAFIMAIGEKLEDITTARARKGLKKLISLTPKTARRVRADGEEETVSVESITLGDIIRIRPGEMIAVDGEIIWGETSIDQSVMTGESLPVDKGIGDSVFSGTHNRFGSIDIKVTRVGEDSSLQRLIRMVKEAEDKKAPMQRTADKWASLLVPLALLIAVISGILMKDIVVAVTVLVVFCPCALVLATPTAIMAAIGQATKHGVIIKSGEALEKMGKVNTVALDKTGTLTYGKLKVSDIASFDEQTDEDTLLSLAASAESRSEHPLGKAVVAYATEKGIELLAAEDFAMNAGKGVSAVVGGEAVLCGNERYLLDKCIDIGEEAGRFLSARRGEGKASLLVARGGKVIGGIALSDTLRPEAERTVALLKSAGAHTVLLTGDSKEAAEHLAAAVGIGDVRAELLPEGKLESIEALRKDDRVVAMIGDGVNDAPSLKASDVGIAMGTMGSDIAVEAADIALTSDDISRIPYLIRLSRATLGTIRFGIATSLIINFGAIALSLMKVLTPTTGALVHNAGSVLVVLIASLLYDRKFDK